MPLDEGCCFVGYPREQHAFGGGISRFALDLFAWHKASSYGTMLEYGQLQGLYGVYLNAYEAMTYWSSPGLLAHGRGVIWDDGFETRQEEAIVLRTALSKGWFVPGLSAHADNGRTVACWRLLRLEEAHPDPAFASRCARLGWDLLDDRLNHVLRVLPSMSVFVSDAWAALTAAAPAAGIVERGGAPEARLEEEDLWERIGFRTETSPYTIGLRLEEPAETDLVWQLQPVLIDRTKPSLVVVCDWDGRPMPGVRMPDHWPQAQIAADIKIRQSRWQAAEPQLEWELDDDQAWQFLESGSVRMIARGVPVYLPQWWEQLRRHRPAVVSQLQQNTGASGLVGLDQLLKFDWRLSLGDFDIGLQEFEEAVRTGRRLIRGADGWILVHPSWIKAIQRMIRKLSGKQTLALSEVIELFLSGGHELETTEASPGGSPKETAQTVRWEVRINSHVQRLLLQLEEKNAGAFKAPDDLQATLRNYQTTGASWLLFMRGCGFGACLADDMGLGKTLQLITYLLELKTRHELDKPALIVCPTSVLGNWQKEIERFAPGLGVYLHYGPKRAKRDGFGEAVSGYDLVLTSYSLVHFDEDVFNELTWSAIVLDEAQNIKNPHGKQSQAVRGLRANHRIAMTGTPVENRLNELWTLFEFINPGYLGGLPGFQRRFGLLDKPPADDADQPLRTERAGQLQRLIRPFLLRRLKSDPETQLDLPEKNESHVYVPLTVEQGALYEAELERMLERIDRLEPMERRGAILAALGKLKQICDHPALYMKETGSQADGDADRSHKLQRLLEMADEVIAEGRQGIIFTQFVEMGKLLQTALEREFGGRIEFLHGGVKKAERDRMIERFQNRGVVAADRPDFSFLVLSLKAGGSGLNLTAASHVFHYDRWWNPAVEEQATDRAYRIGQTRDVQVHKFVALGTLEERIDEMIDRKKTLSRQIVGSGENWITELTTDELKEMFSLRREWVRD